LGYGPPMRGQAPGRAALALIVVMAIVVM
jgi:hypothetical protein